MYATGKGGVVLRAKAEIVEAKGESYNIIVNEVPYQINKSSLLEKIADLVKEKKIEIIDGYTIKYFISKTLPVLMLACISKWISFKSTNSASLWS